MFEGPELATGSFVASFEGDVGGPEPWYTCEEVDWLYEYPVIFDDACFDEANRGGLVPSVLVVILRIWIADYFVMANVVFNVVGNFTPLMSYLVLTYLPIQHPNKLGPASVNLPGKVVALFLALSRFV